MIWNIIVPIIVLGVLICVHEFGHFIVAKWCGVGVLKFSIGFGPALYRVRIGETEYQIGLIPLGGYVRMIGDIPDMITGPQVSDSAVRGEEDSAKAAAAEEASAMERKLFADRRRWFIEKPLWQRSLIVFAGPFFNFILAFVLILISVASFGEGYINTDAVIGSVMGGSPAEHGGLQTGDRVVALDSKPVADWESLAGSIRNGTGATLDLQIERDSQTLNVQVTPQRKEIAGPDGRQETVYLIGIGPSFGHKPVPVTRAAEIAAKWTWHATARTCEGLVGMLSGVISPKELAGPLFIFGEANRQAEKGMEDLLSFMAVLSVSLAVLNLLPIPVLDGGHLLFFLIEALAGPISMRKKEVAQQVGMLLLLCLMVFAIKNDITRQTETTSNPVKWEQPEQ